MMFSVEPIANFNDVDGRKFATRHLLNQFHRCVDFTKTTLNARVLFIAVTLFLFPKLLAAFKKFEHELILFDSHINDNQPSRPDAGTTQGRSP